MTNEVERLLDFTIEELDAALADERKATVERIRAAALVEGMEENINPFDLVHILDAEDER